MKQLLFLLLFPCLALAQYQGNANQKITLGEQTTSDGLVWRGRLADTANLLTNKIDTSVYIVLDTGTRAMWYYRASTTPKWTRLVDSLNNLQGTLSVAKGGTGSATQNFVDLTTPQSIGGAKTFTSAVTATKLNVTDSIQSNSGIYKINSSTLGLNVDNTTPFRITNTGNWGIYNDNPQNLLSAFSLSARGGVISNTYPILMFNEVGNSKFVFGLDANEGYLWGFPGVKLIIATNNTETMRIETSGNVGIGTASPAVQFHTTSNVRFAGLASITDLRTDADGDLFNGSDFNLKNSIDTINFGLSDVLKLKPVSFNWNNEGRNISEYKSMGFIAQDVMDVIPNAASTMGDGDMQVDYNAIVATLTKAIQEQTIIIKQLEQRILILENK